MQPVKYIRKADVVTAYQAAAFEMIRVYGNIVQVKPGEWVVTDQYGDKSIWPTLRFGACFEKFDHDKDSSDASEAVSTESAESAADAAGDDGGPDLGEPEQPESGGGGSAGEAGPDEKAAGLGKRRKRKTS